MQTVYEVRNGQGKLRVSAPRPDIFRITYTKNEAFLRRESLMITCPRTDAVPLEIKESKGESFVSTGRVSLSISKPSLAITYRDASGRTLLAENPWRPREMEPVTVFKCRRDDGTYLRQRTTVDGVRVDARNFAREPIAEAYHTRLNFCFAPGEAVMGFGSHEEGYLNLCGRSRFLYQQNMKACVPFFWSTAGYGMLFDSYTDMTFHHDGYGSYLWTDADDEMDYYFVAGGGFDQVIGGYRFLTGKPPLPPRWSFGFCQSKERYVDQEELLKVAAEYRRREIPLDLIVLDWKSWPGELWGEKNFDASRFPDPARMTRTLHDMGVRMMISIWPHMAPGGRNHGELEEKGLLLLNRSTYDAFSPEARAVYWRQAEEGLFRYGVDAWWCDCTEPFEADWLDVPVKPEPEVRQRINTDEGKTYLDARCLSAYSLQHSRGIYEGQRSASHKRVLNLTRSSYAGQQRYGTITWSGDISANWETLHKQVAEGLSFVSSGCPYWTLDIGGFFVRDWMQWYGDGRYENGPDDPAYRELFLRWFQYGTFLPMMRVHGTDFAREIWRFGEKGDLVYDALVSFVALRYRLLPYLYSLAWRVTEEDYTMMRPLAADYPDDALAHWVEDQFMLGPALMVCPVVEPGATRRTVYLPNVSPWYDFWTGARVSGGMFEADTPLERLPLFVRGGSILPLGPVVQHTGVKVEEPLEVRVYPGADAEFTLYDDDGETYAYERGAFSKRTLHWSESERRLTVSGECFSGGIYACSQVHTIIIDG